MTGQRCVASAVLLSFALLSVVGSPVAAATALPAPAAVDGEAACFPEGGHRMDVGTGDPGMVLVVHTSLFPDVVDADATTADASDESVAATENGTEAALESVSDGPQSAVGMEAYGVALGQEIVSLRVGVLFDGFSNPWGFLTSPWDAFSAVFHYRLSLSGIFGPSVDAYELDEVPVTGVRSAECGG